MHDVQIVDRRRDRCHLTWRAEREGFIAATVIYMILIYALSRLIQLAERRLLRHMQSQSAVTGERGALQPSGMAGMR